MTRVNSPSQTERKPLCPSLPPEIWINIFSYSHDLSHLWNACRRVSPMLRACAERAFSANHLKDVQIEFMLDRHNLGGKRGPHEPAITLEFERIGKRCDDQGIAWFSGHFRGHRIVDPGMRDKTKTVIMQRWRENVEKRKPELPNYTISIRDMVNDTHIPGLSVGSEDYTMQLEWRGMLELFFREQARLETLKARWASKQSSSRKNKVVVASKQIKHRKPAIKTVLTWSWHDVEPDVRKDIRRTRLKQHYRDNDEMVWAINSLKFFEKTDSQKWSSESPRMLPHLPGAGLGERWFGSTNLVQELFLDECSSLNRIDTQMRVSSMSKGG